MGKLSLSKAVCIVFVFCAATTIRSSAQVFTSLASFDGINTGAGPNAVMQGTDGNFYGTTSEGGAYSVGTVFKMTPSGTLTTLYSFCFQANCADGAFPYAGLVQGTDGNFYGTTDDGGANSSGTIFKMTPSGTLTTLYSFCSQANCADGAGPQARLIQATDGNFYGTTFEGGAGNVGAIFKITPSGMLTTLYSFCESGLCYDGGHPSAGLVQGTDGNFYGTASEGGSTGVGTVFTITPGGKFTTLYTFCSQTKCTDGAYPYAGLVQGTDGKFYGTTSGGGTGPGYGTVFAITSSGTLTTLYSFCAGGGVCTDGAYPYAGLVQGADGNFYGTTTEGGSGNCPGSNGCGTIFKITPKGTLTTLHSFDGTDGSFISAGLVLANNGNFYGTSATGGSSNNCNPGCGTVFSLTGPITYTLTVSTSGMGTVTSTDGFINCPGTCSHKYLDGTQVTLNASQAAGWSFSGWSGACSGTGSCNLTMTQNQSVSATFTQNSYTLSVSISGSGTVKSTDGYINCPGTCMHTYLSNTQVTLNASAAGGWSFTGWAGACSGTGSCNLTMTQNQSVSATFTQNSYTLSVSISGSGTVKSTDGYINCPGTCMHTYLSNTQVTLNASAAQGWTFSGWTGACGGVGACNIIMTQNLGVTAVFVELGNGLQFIPVTPCRLVDTRIQYGGSTIQGGTFETFDLPQLAKQGTNCPTLDLSLAAAYSLNPTVVPQGPLGYLTVWPAGQDRPGVSTLNSVDGRVKANAAIVPAGTNGAINVFASNTTDLVLDINGYFTPASGSTLEFYTLTPCRVADTRNANLPSGLGPPHLSAGVARDFPVLNAASCNIPSSALAYSLNFTAVPYPALGDPLGYLEVWPKDQKPQHPVSTLNNLTGTIVANAAIVPAGTSGEITAYGNNDTDLVIDINGYFAAPGQNGLSLYPVAPCRVLDTRKGNGAFTGELTVDVVDSVCSPPNTAQAYVLNATVVPVGPLGYLTLWPDSEKQPRVSTLNAIDGAITSNMAIVPNLDGSIDAYATNLTQLILDISSYFAP